MVNESKIIARKARITANLSLARLRCWSFGSLKLSAKLILKGFVHFFVVPVLAPKLLIASVSAAHVDIAIKILFELFEVVILLQKLVNLLLLLLVVEDRLGHFALRVGFLVCGTCSQ